MRLNGKVAIVTGASRGIGSAIARALACEGAAVVVNYAQSVKDAENTCAAICAAGGRAMAVQADVGGLTAHDRLIAAAVDQFGRLDILVNNAGVEYREPFLQAQPGAWDHTFAVNLKGPYFLAQKAARVMRESDGGKILNVSSVHEETPHRNNSIYTITKGGMRMMTRCLALELAEHKINVNALAPGAIVTDINREVLAAPDFRAQVVAAIPSRRLGEPLDVAGAAVFLVSPEADYVTGITLFVDGGMLLVT